MPDFPLFGAFCFGLVVGWVTYRTLRRSTVSGLGDIATVIGSIAGAAVTGLFPEKTALFSAYCVGLAVGFFGYVITAIIMAPPGERRIEWLGGETPGSAPSERRRDADRIPT